MNKKTILLSALIFFSINALAQDNILHVRPAHNEGKMMTHKEAAGGRLYPRVNLSPEQINMNSNAVSKTEMPVFPEGAENTDCGIKDSLWAYTVGKDLYIQTLNGKPECIASSKGDITYGQFVSRNEFGSTKGTFWSNGGRYLAYYGKDESRVSDFPLLDITTRTGSLKSIKYPMTGMDSERLGLYVYDTQTGKTIEVKADDFSEERYLTNISWSADDKNIFVQVLDRKQKNMHLNMYNAADGSFVRTVLSEHNDKYVEPLDPLYHLKGTQYYIYRTANRDGFRNLYLCDIQKNTVERLTKTNADVEYVRNENGRVYYTSAEISPAENHLYYIDVKAGRKLKIGAPVRVTKERGWHNIEGEFDIFSNFETPQKVYRIDYKNASLSLLGEASDPLADYKTGEVVFGTVKSADGKYDNHYRLIKPVDFDPSKKYPVIVYVYGGPHAQLVRDSWLGSIRMFEMLLSQKGYVVYVQDNRGSANRGLEYEQAIHRNCGQAEMADQMKGVDMLKKLPFVDTERIGVYGWSYGGFMTISLITNYPETFKVAVAGGPVIDWKWYEVMYGERYMDSPQDNPEGYEKVSLINKAKDLKGKLLICQGAVDDVVVWQHSLNFVSECIKNEVQVDYFPYPTSKHNVYPQERAHLETKILNYFEANLKPIH